MAGHAPCSRIVLGCPYGRLGEVEQRRPTAQSQNTEAGRAQAWLHPYPPTGLQTLSYTNGPFPLLMDGGPTQLNTTLLYILLVGN